MNRFDGKRVLLTGAASGIGRATAVRLVSEGAAVCAVDIDADGMARTATACQGPGSIVTATCDVTSESSVVAAELIGRGIRVVPVSPGTVATPLTAAVTPGNLDFSYYGRIRSLMGAGEPEQIAGVIAFAASDDASYLTGVELRVDGGSHI